MYCLPAGPSFPACPLPCLPADPPFPVLLMPAQVSSLAKLHFRPPSSVLLALLDALSRCLHEASGQSLANLLWALAAMRVRPSDGRLQVWGRGRMEGGYCRRGRPGGRGRGRGGG